MKVLFGIICDQAEAREDGRLDIQGVFQQLYAPGFPAEHRLTLAVAVEWEPGEEGRRPFRIDLVGPDGSPALTISGHTDVGGPDNSPAPPQTRLLMPIDRVIFPQAGRYQFVFEQGDDSVPLSPLYLIEDQG